MISLPQNLAAINWTFKASFDSISFDFVIHEELKTRKGLFFQFFDGRINESGMYFGIQTNVFKPQKGFIGNAVIFSQWGTGNEQNILIPEDGFIQNSTHEEQFIGVRKPIKLQKGKYQIKVRKTQSDEFGDWYNITLQHENELPVDCGSLRFPLSVKRGFDDGGGTWAELYSTGEAGNQLNDTEMPELSLSITKVVAGEGNIPKTTDVKYPYAKENKFSKITINKEKETVKFEIGADVQR